MRYWLAALAIAGCIYESGGHRDNGAGGSGGIGGGPGGAGGGAGDGGVNGGYIQLSWTVGDQATGLAIPCRAGETVLIQVGNFLQDYPCPDMFEHIGPIPAGTYSLRASLLDVNRSVEAVQTADNLVVQVNATTDAGNLFFLVPNGFGSMTFSWEVRTQAGGASTCTTNELVQADFGGGMIYQVQCSALSASLQGLPAARYNTVLSLMSGPQVESQQSTAVTIVPNGNTDAGHFVFVH